MRVSSGTIFDQNVAALTQQQTRLLQTQQQVSSGRRILTAADDPVAAARALSISQSDAMNTQYAANRTAARHTLSLAESTLQSVTSLLQDVKTAAVGAGNGSLNNSDRQTIATGLSGRLQELIGLANSTDGAGNYLFSGFQSATQPFVNVAGVMTYNGDDGQRLMQVAASRQMASSDSGADIFMRVKNGNGTFATQAVASNTGSGVISAGFQTGAVTGHSYTVAFGAINTQAPTGTRTVASGAISGSDVTVAGTTASTATFTVDGITLFSNTVAAGATGTLITGANLDAAWPAFAAANPGYTLTGTFAAGTAQITKANGTALVLAENQAAGTGATLSAFAAAGAGFIGTTAAGTGMGGTIGTPATVTNPAVATGHDYSITFGAGGTTYSVQDLTTNKPVPGMSSVAYTSGAAIAFDGISVAISGTPVQGDVFNVAAPTYSVTDNTTGTTVATAQRYVSGQAISFGGMQFDISGIPLPNDRFTVQPSGNVSIFQTISDLIAALNTPVGVGNPTQTAALNTSLQTAMNLLDRGLNNVLSVRSSLGLRLSEVDALQVTGEDLSLQYKQNLSQLQDVDYNKALSDLTQQQIGLQAAQKSFVNVSGLSLFNYL